MITSRIISERTRLEEVIPLSTPFVVAVDPSSSCNLKCRFCYQSDPLCRKKLMPGIMGFGMFSSVIDNIGMFPQKVKTLRLYGFGEPVLNKHFADMVRLAKGSGCAESIDTTTNGTLLTPDRIDDIIDAGIDRINLSIYGVSSDQYKSFTGIDIDFDSLVNNITYLYNNRGRCRVFAKINGDYITEDDRRRFTDIFSNITDGCAIEHTAACWDDFDVAGLNQELDIYGKPLGKEVAVCPYIFYSIQIHSDGTVSLCFLDWNRKLLIGDLTSERLVDIWNGDYMRKIRRMMLNWERDRLNPCSSCGQLKYGSPDNIDKYSGEILGRLR